MRGGEEVGSGGEATDEMTMIANCSKSIQRRQDSSRNKTNTHI